MYADLLNTCKVKFPINDCFANLSLADSATWLYNSEHITTQRIKTSLRLLQDVLKRVAMSYDQTGRCHDVLQRTSDLRRLEDIGIT